MSFLTNTEIETLLKGSEPPVLGIEGSTSVAAHESALEAASVRLKVGKIFQLDKNSESKNILTERLDETIIKEGGVVLVLTAEKMNLSSDLMGLVTPKSGGMAERGILITNTGHVDPGYKGNLRFVVINMGHEPFCLRVNDVIAKLMLYQLNQPANPDWSAMHSPIPVPTAQSARSLGYDFLNIETRASQIAEQKAKEVVNNILLSYGIPGFLLSTALACLLGVLSVAITYALTK
jgi:dCTP deaminase